MIQQIRLHFMLKIPEKSRDSEGSEHERSLPIQFSQDGLNGLWRRRKAEMRAAQRDRSVTFGGAAAGAARRNNPVTRAPQSPW